MPFLDITGNRFNVNENQNKVSPVASQEVQYNNGRVDRCSGFRILTTKPDVIMNI